MGPVKTVSSLRCAGGTCHPDTDPLVVEEPLEIRLGGEPVVVTMRTPGNDSELAAGFLYTEGILTRPDQVGAIRHCQDSSNPEQQNIVEVGLAEGARPPRPGWQRSFYSTSSCGICGKASIEAVRLAACRPEDTTRFQLAALYTMPVTLREGQAWFAETGALHAAGVFFPSGKLDLLREDVGRHNAVDKVVGACFIREDLPLGGRILLVSGRVSFEIAQKALMAGIPAVAGISGVSSLAVELAEEAGMLLIGFLRDSTLQVYAGTERLFKA